MDKVLNYQIRRGVKSSALSPQRASCTSHANHPPSLLTRPNAVTDMWAHGLCGPTGQ